MTDVLLINPNTSAATTARMVEIARLAAPGGLAITGATAPFGAPLITDEAGLAEAGRAVLSLVPAIAGRHAGVIVSAFGDPGLEGLRRRLAIPVAGIGEAGILEAGAGGRRFAIVTTTGGLVRSIGSMVERLGFAPACAGVALTRGDPAALMAEPSRLLEALHEAICEAVAGRGAEAVVIGGGPLATAARALAPAVAVPVIEPIPAAVRWVVRAIAEGEASAGV